MRGVAKSLPWEVEGERARARETAPDWLAAEEATASHDTADTKWLDGSSADDWPDPPFCGPDQPALWHEVKTAHADMMRTSGTISESVEHRGAQVVTYMRAAGEAVLRTGGADDAYLRARLEQLMAHTTRLYQLFSAYAKVQRDQAAERRAAREAAEHSRHSAPLCDGRPAAPTADDMHTNDGSTSSGRGGPTEETSGTSSSVFASLRPHRQPTESVRASSHGESKPQEAHSRLQFVIRMSKDLADGAAPPPPPARPGTAFVPAVPREYRMSAAVPLYRSEVMG